MDALSRSFLPATSRNEPYFLDPCSQQMTAVSAYLGEMVPKLKTRGKLSLNVRRATAFPSSGVPHATVFRICWKNLFPLALASARWWIKSPRAHVCFENARARVCMRVCVRARAPSTLLNSFLYYVFSESECNLPSRPSLSPPPRFHPPRTGRKRFSPTARQVINTPEQIASAIWHRLGAMT